MLLKQSTARDVTFYMVLAADHITGATGKTVTVTLSKNGAAFAAAAGAVSEISSGWYKVALSTVDSNTLGDLAVHCTATACDDTDFRDQVVADLPGATVSSVTGAVGSVTGATGSVTGAVGSVTGNVGGNVVGTVASVVGNVGGNVTGTVASVVGNVGGNVVGSVGSVLGAVASVTAGVIVTTNNDKTGYSLVAGQFQVKKNTSFSNFSFPMFSSTSHQLITGKTVAVVLCIDGAALVAATNAVAEVGGGIYKLNFAAADLNGNSITAKFTSSGCDDLVFTFITQA